MVAYKERAPGTYVARFVKLDTAYEITDKDTQETVLRWRWVFQEVDDPTTVGELDTITSPSFKARTNGLKLFTGMLGRPPTDADDTDDLIGQVFDVIYGPNQNGRYTVVGAMKRGGNVQTAPVPAASTSPVYEGMEGYGAPTVVPEQRVAQTPDGSTQQVDDLPF